MPRNTIYALILIAVLVVVFLFNHKGSVDVNLVAANFNMMKSLAFLMFTALGVLIGVLLK